MIGTIRKHSTALWLIIIVVIIFAFVIWGSKTGPSDSRADYDYGSINGERVTADAFQQAGREAALRFFLMRGEWPDRGYDDKREAYVRLVMIQKQKDLGIYASEAAVAELAKITLAGERLRALNQGNPVPFPVFVERVLMPRKLTADDFHRYLRHEIGIQQLVLLSTVAGAAVTEGEVRALYTRENEELSTQAAFFVATNFLAGVTATPDAVAQFYTNRMSAYRLPDRMRVSYVRFAASNFLAEAVAEINQRTNLAEQIEMVYQIQKTNVANAGKTAEELKASILKEGQENAALLRARNKAAEFAAGLYNLTPARAENLELFAKSNGLTVEISQPFDREKGPKELQTGPEFGRAAFAMTADEPFAGPLVGANAVYVIAPKQKLPSENPPFETVREQVVQDYKLFEAAAQARKAGEQFLQTLTNGLAAKKTFMTVCAEQKIKPVLPRPFSISTPDVPEVESLVSLQQFKQAAFTTPLKQPSPLVPMRDGAFIVFVAEKLPLDETKMRADLPNFARMLHMHRQNEAFNTWFSQEAGRALRDVPYFREQEQQRQKAAGR